METSFMSAETQMVERTTVALEPPKDWKVVFLNDDVTPMEFVVCVLTEIFRHDPETAFNLTREIHEQGSGVAGIYSHEIAEQKGMDTTTIARKNGFPLKVTLEIAD